VPAFIVCTFSVSAQQFVAPRITRPVRDSELVTLPQKTHPLARPEFDRGPAPPSLPMNRMMLVLKRSPDQTAQLKTLLDSQLRAASPQYHKWLTPEQFGARFGAADQDLKTVAAWLQSHGFTVRGTAKGKGTIEFSGNAGQVSETFHTAIHRFVVNGEEHWANTSSPGIPAALAPVVGGISTLNNFRLQTQGANRAIRSYPLFTAANGDHALAPADYATIYNISPLYQATPAIDGTGVTIAVVGATSIDPQDVTDFRKEFGIKAYQPQIMYPYGQPTNSDPQAEAALDVSWSGAIAPGAAINFVAIPDTFADSGLLLAENYIVDNNLGDIVTESFSVCEAYSYPALNTFIESTREQAAAQGMTYVVSSGDSGPYGCDAFDTELTVADPTLLSVNLLAASPYVTAVGGTMFNDGTNPSQFWNSVTRLPFGTAKSYIPEDAWEESCDSTFCFMNILAGSGGQSSVYPKPSWQSGVTGIQQDGTRDLPDVSLAAASTVPYLFCLSGSCESGGFYAGSGTSAAAPSFAGIMALVRQKVGTRLGAINPQLYALAAAETYSSCNGSTNTVASTCIFHDITVGSNGVNGEPNFGTSTALYQATVGYDMATGLGSVNAANLANSWNLSGEQPTTTTLTLSPTTLVHGAAANMTISVAPASGTGVPTGPVDLNSSTVSLGSFLLTSGTAQSTTVPLAGGTYTVSALYGGDGKFAPSTSSSVSVSVSPEPSMIVTEVDEADLSCDFSPFCPVTSAPFGSPIELGAQVSGVSGVGAPSGTVTFTDSASTAGGSLVLNNDGSSIFSTSSLAVGAHTITMTYPGDASFMPSTAPPLALTITPATTTVILTPGSFCGTPNTSFPLTGVVTSPYNLVQEGTLTVTSSSPQITAPVSASTDLTLPSLPTGLNTIAVSYSGDSNYLPSTGTVVVNTSSGTCLAAMVNAADYQAGVAPKEIVSIFGENLGSSSGGATGTTLPQTLNGASVTITDSFGNTLPADLFFVSPTQINLAVPAGVATGAATAQVTGPQGVSQFPIQISAISPAIFTADGSGSGLASAEIVRDHQNQLTTTVVTNTATPFSGDNLYLVLFGTGFDNVSPRDTVEIMFNGQITYPSYIGPQNTFEGLDQINVPLPPSLADEGQVTIQVMINGLFSNVVTVPF
jgi:uncharacterized protein (TIGR03437 family)